MFEIKKVTVFLCLCTCSNRFLDYPETREKYHIDFDQLKQLPFQVQVNYTAVDGSKALRVLTQLKEITNDREVAEVNAVRSVIAENHIRSTANDMM